MTAAFPSCASETTAGGAPQGRDDDDRGGLEAVDQNSNVSRPLLDGADDRGFELFSDDRSYWVRIKSDELGRMVIFKIIALATLAQFMKGTITGDLTSGERFEDTVDPRIWEDMLNQPYPMNIPPVDGHDAPINRIWHAFGRKGNTEPFVLALRTLNDAKKRVWTDRDVSAVRSDTAMDNAIRPGTNAALREFVNEVRRPLMVLMFINSDMARSRARGAYRALRAEMRLLSTEAVRAGYRDPGLHNMLDRFIRDHIETITQDVRKFVERWGITGVAAIAGSGVPDEREFPEAIAAIRNGVADFRYNFEEWFSDEPSRRTVAFGV